MVVEPECDIHSHPQEQHDAISQAMTRTKSLIQLMEATLEAAHDPVHVYAHRKDRHSEEGHGQAQGDELQAAEEHVESECEDEQVVSECENARDTDAQHEGLMSDNLSMSYEETVNKLLEHVINLHKSASSELLEQQLRGSDVVHEAHVGSDSGTHVPLESGEHDKQHSHGGPDVHARTDVSSHAVPGQLEGVQHDSHAHAHAHGGIDTHVHSPTAVATQASNADVPHMHSQNHEISHVSHEDGHVAGTQDQVSGHVTAAKLQEDEQGEKNAAVCSDMSASSGGAQSQVHEVALRDGDATRHDNVHARDDHTYVAQTDKQATLTQDHAATATAGGATDAHHVHIGAASQGVCDDQQRSGSSATSSAGEVHAGAHASSSAESRTDSHVTPRSDTDPDDTSASAFPPSKRAGGGFNIGKVCLTGAKVAAVPLTWWLLSTLAGNKEISEQTLTLALAHINRVLDILKDEAVRLKDEAARSSEKLLDQVRHISTVVAKNAQSSSSSSSSSDARTKSANQGTSRAPDTSLRGNARNDKKTVAVTASAKHLLSMVPAPALPSPGALLSHIRSSVSHADFRVMGSATAVVGGGAAVMSASLKLAGFVNRRTCAQGREHVSAGDGDKLGNSSDGCFRSSGLQEHDVHAYQGHSECGDSHNNNDDELESASAQALGSSERWRHGDGEHDARQGACEQGSHGTHTPQSSSQFSRDDTVARLLESMRPSHSVSAADASTLNSGQDVRSSVQEFEAGEDSDVAARSEGGGMRDDDEHEHMGMLHDMTVTVIDSTQHFEQHQVVGVISLVHCGTLAGTQNPPRAIGLRSSDTVSSLMHTLGLREPAHYLVCRERVLDPTCTFRESAVTNGDTVQVCRYVCGMYGAHSWPMCVKSVNVHVSRAHANMLGLAV